MRLGAPIAGTIEGRLDVAYVALVDRFIRSPGCSRALDDGPLLGSPARQRDAPTRPTTLRTRRIRPGRPGGCDLGDLESPPVSIHATNHSLGRGAVGVIGTMAVDRILLPAVDRHILELRKNLARLQKSGVSRIHDGIRG